MYDVRLALAGQGVPSQGTMGMELFDTTNLGMTDFIQQVNYQRAMEGELARTISSLNSVKSPGFTWCTRKPPCTPIKNSLPPPRW
jgi:flagellar M-ring protein FliF